MNDSADINRLLKRLARGDEDALDELYAMIGGRLFYVALSVTRNRADAEEVVSDAFVAFVQKANTFRAPFNGYGWCARITRNLALNVVRKRGAPTADIDDFFDLSDGVDEAERAADKAAVEQAMRALTSEERRIVVLYYYDDLTVREIAFETGMPKSTVARTLKRALESMRKILG